MKSLIRKEILKPLNLNESIEPEGEDVIEDKTLKTKDPDAVEVAKEPKKELVEKDKKIPYGEELILDIHGVDRGKITAANVKKFAADLCDEIGMKKGPNYVWGNEENMDHEKNPKADGISCVQFLYTSSIIVHAIDELNKVFINVFSCHEFDQKKATAFALKTWGGELVASHDIIRK